MIKVSIGTAIELGIQNGSLDIIPTTAYLMIGDKCDNKCAFCSQSIESTARKDKLSRVIWPEIDEDILIKSLVDYKNTNIKRICLQVMGNSEAVNLAKDFTKKLIKSVNMPISVSAKVESEKDIEELLGLGIEKIGLAIDGANDSVYSSVKGGDFTKRVDFIKKMGKSFPGRISTHIIVGLGESHEDIFNLYGDMLKNNITVSLFAFTPVKGTKLEKLNQPLVQDYRRVQLMTYLIKKGYTKEHFNFVNEELTGINNIDDETKKEIHKGQPFEISGCKDCNRPYYNERPGKTIYNYSRKLDEIESEIALLELNLDL